MSAAAEGRTPASGSSLLGNRLPYWVVLVLAAGMFGAGRMSVDKQVPVALAEQSAVLMRIVLEHPELDAAQIEKKVRAPMRELLQRYGRQGYMVVDVATTDAGGYSLLALPSGSVDITGELLSTIQATTASASPAPAPAPAPASGPAALASSPLKGH